MELIDSMQHITESVIRLRFFLQLTLESSAIIDFAVRVVFINNS